MSELDNNWQIIFINFVLLGVILLLFFRIFNFGLPWMIKNLDKRSLIKRRVPVVEIAVWFIFLSWFTFRFASNLEVYAIIVAAILFILLFWFAKFYLREIIAGIIFKTSGRYKTGDMIRLNRISGKIFRMGMDALELESSEGFNIFIPYSKLVGGPILTRVESAEQGSGYNFTLITEPKDNIKIFEKEMQSFVLTLPWANIEKPVQISFKTLKDSNMVFEVTLFLLDKSYLAKAEGLIRKKFEERSD